MSPRAVGIIPARFASTRFPGKPLVPIAGRPMIQRVFDGARQAKHLDEVVIATDDERIAEACAAFEAPVVMTAPDHPTGTDRLAEAARGLDAEIIVNIQGDEPLIEGFVVDAAIDALADSPEAPMSTVAHRAAAGAENDPNRVKVVLDRSGYALYFSRAPVPFARDAGAAPTYLQHIGLYAYRRDFLLEFVGWPQTEAEKAESLEQLRALENGRRIRVAVIEGWESLGVDVPDDVRRVEARLGA
ncbi:MAG: 3-deoxy-manno-octulosonate cytidylyltransferase [Myxococcota bacterium]